MEKYRSVEMFSPMRSAQSPSMSPFRSPLQSPLTSGRYSSTIDEDETALRWAAIEKLPIYEQLRTSVLREEVQTENGKKKFEHREVDVRNLAIVERQQFIERIFKVAEEDNERFLKKLRSRIDKVGIQLPTVQVRFERLTVRAQCYVGTRALPTLFNTTRNTIELILGSLGIGINKKTNLTILKDASGIINPSRMTLLLGPPASGKTTLLLALAGKLDPALESSGEVTYNGYQLNQFVSQKTAAYISQHDLHAGEMTVKETLDFSARCQGVGPRYELLNELAKREKEAGIFPDAEVDLFMKATAQGGIKSSLQTDYTLRILGLDICADTIVGDEMLRGISGGQKKRLTTGEMIVGPTKTLFMDEISTGLDSSTTFQIVKCLQQIVHLGEATILMSLLQPAPETFDLFDDIILLSEGQIVYQGPREYVLDFFQSCGFRCPERKSTVDFVQEVTSRKDQEQYWGDKSKPYRYVSVSDFVKRFKRFHIGLSLQNELSMPFDKKKNHEAALTFSRRLVPTSELLSASFSKEWLLITRNSFIYVFKTVQLVIVAIIASTVFLRTKMPSNNEADGAVFSGALIYGVIVNMFNGFAELSFAIMRLPVFYKHRDLLLYPAWVFTLPNVVLRIPIAIFESFIWVCMTYYSIGFAPEASRFFKMLLIIILISQTAAGLFRVVAGIFRSHVVANAGGTIIFLLFFVLGGFIQPKDKIPNWWSWGYWISPFPYAYNAVAVNEFFSPRWMDKITPDGRRLGAAILENNSIPVNENWYWIGAGALLAYAIICNVIFTIALSYLSPPGRQQAVISEETAMEMEDNEDESDESPRLKRTWSSRVSTPRSLSANDGNNTPETRKRRLGGYSGTASPRDFRSYESSANYETSGIYPSKKGMVLPFTPLAMSFRDVNYYVDMPAEMKAQGVTEERLQLLKGVTSAFRPGVLTALMGVSGAGKTTLMDVLAGRKTGGYIEGDIRISGFRKNQATFARISGYCEQNDIHSPQVTIKESLIYSTFLRLPQLVTNEEKMRFVDEVMNLVELDTIQDAIVGLPGVTGLSTEQRKRLTIAVELVANPSIIFMDEPTSGLDARAAAVVMRAVRNTVDTGRTVVCTIHQPSIDIFESFDELLLLKRGGQVIYSGSLGKNSCKMIEYFESIPGVPKHNDKCNPATWMLDASSVATEVRLRIDFADLYKSSSLYRRNKALVKGLKKPLPGTSDLYFPAQYAQSDYQQFKFCLWKQWWTYWRSPDYNLVRFFFCWFTGLLLGSIFWDIGHTRESSLDFTMIIGTMYVAILFAGFNNASTVQPVVVVERMVFYRERAAGMYSALPYAFAQMIVELPYVFLQTLVYDLILYSMLGFEWTLVKFSWFFFASFFTFLYFTYYGMMCVAISPNLQVAMLISATFYTLFNLFSGFFVAKASIPKWWIWYYWICPVAWTVNGLVTPQFGDLDDIIRVPGQQNQTIKAYIDNQFGFNLDFIGAVAGVLVGFTLLFAFVFAYGIKKMNFQQR